MTNVKQRLKHIAELTSRCELLGIDTRLKPEFIKVRGTTSEILRLKQLLAIHDAGQPKVALAPAQAPTQTIPIMTSTTQTHTTSNRVENPRVKASDPAREISIIPPVTPPAPTSGETVSVLHDHKITAQCGKTLEQIGRCVYGDAMVEAWKGSRGPGGMCEQVARNLHVDSLGAHIAGFPTNYWTGKIGTPPTPFGLNRTAFANKLDKLTLFLA